MNTAKYITEITVIDPDSNAPVELTVLKHENGGMFAMDSSYLDQCFEDDIDPVIADPFEEIYTGEPVKKLVLIGL
jgi:hypothetical protein